MFRMFQRRRLSQANEVIGQGHLASQREIVEGLLLYRASLSPYDNCHCAFLTHLTSFCSCSLPYSLLSSRKSQGASHERSSRIYRNFSTGNGQFVRRKRRVVERCFQAISQRHTRPRPSLAHASSRRDRCAS